MRRLIVSDLIGTRGCDMSDCGQYRDRLWREWDASLPRLAVFMLNPSDARHDVPDPTDTRIYLRAMSLGFGRYDIGNLFPLSSSDPKALRTHANPLGPADHADQVLLEIAEAADTIICAWGADPFAVQRSSAVLALLRDAGHGPKLHCLALNKDGSPKHPLYIPMKTRPVPFQNVQRKSFVFSRGV